MRRFFFDPIRIENSVYRMATDDARHLVHVLRLSAGDAVSLFDGSGMEYEGRILCISEGSVDLVVGPGIPCETESPVYMAVAQGFLKEKKMDGLVRMLTELGVSRWIPFVATRSVSRPDQKRMSVRRERWGKIARESLKQCRRATVPVITPAHSFSHVLATARDFDLKIMFWEDEQKSLEEQVAVLHGPKRIFVLLGPEGGFSGEEVRLAKAAGFVCAGLGPRILRAETATLAACVVVQYVFGDMGQKKS
jgi:16S rRNA (uracil1498-N3)-methyltransferase